MVKKSDITKNLYNESVKLGKVVSDMWSWIEEEITKGGQVVLSDMLKKQIDMWKQTEQTAEDFQKKMEALYDELAKQKKRNFDKEIEDLKKVYEERFKLAKDNEEEILRLKEEYAKRVKRIEAEKQAILTPEEIKKQEQAKVADILGLAKSPEIKEASVGGVTSELQKVFASSGLGQLGEGIKLISGIIKGVLTGASGALLAVGGFIGLLMIIKNVEKHNREILEESRKISMNTGLMAEFSAKDYSNLVSTLRHEFGLTRKEAQDLIKNAFSINLGSIAESSITMMEALRAQREAGINFNDFTKNLLTLIGREEGNARTLGILFDLVRNMNAEFTRSGFHFTLKQLNDVVNETYGAFKNFGGRIEDGIGILEKFKDIVNDGTFTFKQLIDMEKNLINLDEQKLGGWIAYGQQLGELTDLTGDIYDKMWKLRMSGAVGGSEMLNVVMRGVEDIMNQMGYNNIAQSYEIGYELARKQFGLSQVSDPRQWERLVQLWEESGKHLNISREQIDKLVKKTEEQHDFNIKESKEYFNKALGFMNKIENDIGTIREKLEESVSYNSRAQSSYKE